MAKFLSRCDNQVLCMVPSRVQIADGIAVPVPGKKISFDRGEYETKDAKEIKFIRSHALFNVSITEVPAKGGEEQEGPKEE